jgi:hypothetical protein
METMTMDTDKNEHGEDTVGPFTPQELAEMLTEAGVIAPCDAKFATRRIAEYYGLEYKPN